MDDSIIKNLKYTFLCHILSNILKFVQRMVFVQILSVEYVGLNNFLSNVISVLSLTEFGLGSAIIYSLYNPLAKNDCNKISYIINMTKKIYYFLAVMVIILGLILLPFVIRFIKDGISDDFYLYYMLFLINTSVSYLFSHKRMLLIADCKTYLVNIYSSLVQTLILILQIVSLYLASSYTIFLLLMIMGTIFENYLISQKVDNNYVLKVDKYITLDKIDKAEIINEVKNNIKSIFLHRLGVILLSSNNNIVISNYLGLTYVGLYNNYYLVFTMICLLSGKILEALRSNIGRLLIYSKDDGKKIYQNVEFYIAWYSLYIGVGIYVCIDKFICTWFGSQYVLADNFACAIAVYCYLQNMRYGILVVKEACGLYGEDKYKDLLESIVNIVLAVLLIQNYGIIGVMYSNILSTLLVSFWVEPYVVFKNLKFSGCINYYKNYIFYFAITVFISIVTKYVCKSIIENNRIVDFFLEIALCLCITTILWIIIFYKNKILRSFLQYVFLRRKTIN